MVKESGAQAAAGKADLFAEAHRQLLADPSIQFELRAFKPAPPPAWLKGFGDFVEGIFPLLQGLFWAILAAAAILLVVLVVRRIEDGTWTLRRRPRGRSTPEAESWRPEEAPARALLREAEALAAEGRYGEAAHLLLFRSIEEIDRRRPALVRPALTSRDIAGAPALPAGPRSAFTAIVMKVERSLFGGRTLGEGDWQECRAAYQDFAFGSGWRE